MQISTASDFEKFVLGDKNETVDVSTGEEARIAALSMARQATRTLDIVSRDLDAPVYDTMDFVEAVKSLALRGPRSRVRIIVRDTAKLASGGHRLVNLAMRLPTFIEIRIPAHEHENFNAALLVADASGVIYRNLADRYAGTVNFHDPRHADELTRLFDEMWGVAGADPNLRRMHI